MTARETLDLEQTDNFHPKMQVVLNVFSAYFTLFQITMIITKSFVHIFYLFINHVYQNVQIHKGLFLFRRAIERGDARLKKYVDKPVLFLIPFGIQVLWDSLKNSSNNSK